MADKNIQPCGLKEKELTRPDNQETFVEQPIFSKQFPHQQLHSTMDIFTELENKKRHTAFAVSQTIVRESELVE